MPYGIYVYDCLRRYPNHSEKDIRKYYEISTEQLQKKISVEEWLRLLSKENLIEILGKEIETYKDTDIKEYFLTASRITELMLDCDKYYAIDVKYEKELIDLMKKED